MFFRILKAALALLILAIPMSDLLLNRDRLLIYRDTLRTFLPLKTFWVNSVLVEGKLPRWNPYILAGTPAWADLKSGVLYPLNCIFIFFGRDNVGQGLTWFVYCHFVFAAWGAYFLLRRLGTDQKLAFLFGVLYPLMGAFTSSTSMLNVLAAAMIAPFFCYFMLGWAKQRNEKWLSPDEIGLISTLALCVYAGSPEYAYFFAILLAIWGGIERKSSLFTSLTKVGLGSALLSAAQIIPGLLSVEESKYSITKNLINRSYYSFDPNRLAEFFYFLPFGNFKWVDTYWGGNFSNSIPPLPLFFSSYLGFFGALGLIGFIFDSSKNRAKTTLALLTLMVFSFGEYLPVNFFEWARYVIPFWKITHYPEKLLVLISLVAWVVQVYGWTHLIKLTEVGDARRLGRISFAWFICSIVMTALVYFLVHSGSHHLSLQTIIYYFSFNFVSLACLYLHCKRLMSSKTIFAILFAIFCFDLTAHSWSLIWDVPKSILNQPIQDKILTHLGTMQPELEHGAAFRFTALAARPDQAINHEPKGVKLSPAGQHGQSILYRGLSSTGILYGLSDIAGNGAAGNRTRSDLFKAIGDADPKRLLDLTSVRYFSVLDESDLTHVSVKMNLESLPFLYFPKRLIFSEVGGVGARELLDSNFYPKDEIYVELGSKSTEVNGSYTSPRIVTQSNDRIEIEVTPLKRDQGDVLVINQSYDRWWKARIGKTPLNILRVNGWAMGVDLARQCPVAGCVVVVEYDNLLITAGTWVTLLFLCFLLWCIFKMRKSIDG